MEPKKPLPIKELCIAGACQRGICYIGCIEKLEELELLKKDKLEKLIGVSMGSFISLGYLIGYTPEDFLNLIVHTNTSLFKDIELVNNGIALLKGKSYRDWVWNSIAAKIDPNTTFKELYEMKRVNFLVISTCIEDGMFIFSHKHTPDVSVYDGVIASMNFPYVFPPYIIDGKRHVDGGVVNNFPMEMLGKDALGLRVSHESFEDIKSIFTYTGKLFDIIVKHMRKLTPSKSENIVVVNASDFSLIDFDLTLDEKITLYRRGYDSIENSEVIRKMVENEVMENEVIEVPKIKRRNTF